eukprot:7096506-Prymnesium_polylepis.2
MSYASSAWLCAASTSGPAVAPTRARRASTPAEAVDWAGRGAGWHILVVQRCGRKEEPTCCHALTLYRFGLGSALAAAAGSSTRESIVSKLKGKFSPRRDRQLTLVGVQKCVCLLYTSPSPRDAHES